jgi:hypothetical protein
VLQIIDTVPVSFQGSDAACSLALKPDGVVVPRRHSLAMTPPHA